MTPDELGRAAARGSRAGKLELPVEFNPYQPGSSAWKVWRSMWQRAIAARLRADMAQASAKIVRDGMRVEASDVERLMAARQRRRAA